MASVWRRKGPDGKPSGNWLVSYFDHTGKRRERSTGTMVKRAAERIASKWEADAQLRKEGVIDHMQDRYAQANRVPIAEHVEAYIAHCKHVGEGASLRTKRNDLERYVQDTGISRLSDMNAETLSKHMWRMREFGMKRSPVNRIRRHAGLAPATVNNIRRHVISFANWCVKTDRLRKNPLKSVGKLDQRKEKRHERRPFTDGELARLMAVAEVNGRKPWYMTALLAGLRKSDLARLCWGDIDFDAKTITITEGKAKRTDVVPLHPQLEDELRRLRDEKLPHPGAKVFGGVDTRTWRRDFLLAGIAREEQVVDEDGQQVMVQKRRRQWRLNSRGEERLLWTLVEEPLTRIVTDDEEGRVVDFHALRMTVGDLARSGRRAAPARPANHATRRLPRDVAALHRARVDRHGRGVEQTSRP